MGAVTSWSIWAPAGVVFAFFAIDGLFHRYDDGIKEQPFVNMARRIFKAHRESLLFAIDNERLSSRLTLASRRSSKRASKHLLEDIPRRLVGGERSGSSSVDTTAGLFLAFQGFLVDGRVKGVSSVREKALSLELVPSSSGVLPLSRPLETSGVCGTR